MIPRRLLPNTVTLIIGGGRNQFGPLPGEHRTVKALVEGGNRLIRDRTGAQVVSSVRVYTDPVNINVGDQVRIWPGDSLEQELRVLQVNQFRAPGKSHTVIDLE